MEPILIFTIILYLLSSAAHAGYFFSRKPEIYYIGHALLIAGFLCHLVMTGYLFITTLKFPVHNLFQTLSFTGLAIVGVFFVFNYKFKLKILGLYTAPLVSLLMLVAYQFPAAHMPAQNISNNFLLTSHIIMIFLGNAAFALACGIGSLYLLQENAIKTKNHGFIFKRLPSLNLLDTAGQACVMAGFTLLTIGLITGSVYAKLVWGRFWSWDPKEVWSALTWLYYALLLHERFTVGWRGRKAAIMSIIGFIFMLFTFFGVNLLLKGHHGQFTRW